MEYLTAKWKIWYKSLDVNHDGKISFEDVEESRSKFTNLHELIGDKASSVKVDMEKWWTTYIFPKNVTEISEEEFIANLSSQRKASKEEFEKHIRKCFDTIFDVIDTNKDRSISLEEFIFAFKAFGHENEGVVKKAYGLFKEAMIQEKGESLVPLGVIVDAWIQFVTCEDCKKTDVVKQAFDSGV